MSRRYVLQLLCLPELSEVPLYYAANSSGHYVDTTADLLDARLFDSADVARWEVGHARRIHTRAGKWGALKNFFKSPKHTSKDPRYVAIPVDVSVTVSQ